MSVQSEVSRIEGLKAELSNYLVSIEEADGSESLETLIGKAVAIMGSYGDRISALEAGNGSALSALFDISILDTIHVQEQSDASKAVADSLYLDGFIVPVGTSGISFRRPVVTVSDIEWEAGVDDNYNITGTGMVEVSFGEAGSLIRTATFKKPGPGKLYAVSLSDRDAMIKTGIAADYAYRYHVKGHTFYTGMCVLVDAYISNLERATARILGTSQKIQLQWASNQEVLASSISMNFQKMFEMTCGANYMQLTQSGRTVTPYVSGHTKSGNVGTDITLMGSTAMNYGNSVLCFAEIIDGSGNTLAYFSPYRIQGEEVVLLDTNGLNAQQIADIIENGDGAEYAGRIYRPTVGTLIEVTKAEDDSL